MFTIFCQLTFPDGATVSGQLSAMSPEGEFPVTYAGALDRLPRRFERTSAAVLKALFQNLSADLPAALEIREAGQYDFWAEYQTDVPLDQSAFHAIADEIESLGYAPDIAARYAALIGDTPTTDDAGNILVMDWTDNRILARLKLKFFESITGPDND